MIPELGKTYVDTKGNKRTVASIEDNKIWYYKNKSVIPTWCHYNFFVNKYIRFNRAQTEPLDQAFKQLDKQLCSHRNIREDRYFSAMVYKTCKDCGQALN